MLSHAQISSAQSGAKKPWIFSVHSPFIFRCLTFATIHWFTKNPLCVSLNIAKIDAGLTSFFAANASIIYQFRSRASSDLSGSKQRKHLAEVGSKKIRSLSFRKKLKRGRKFFLTTTIFLFTVWRGTIKSDAVTFSERNGGFPDWKSIDLQRHKYFFLQLSFFIFSIVILFSNWNTSYQMMSRWPNLKKIVTWSNR